MSSRIFLGISLLLFLNVLTVGQSPYSLAACESSAKAKELPGHRFKLKVGKEAIVRKGGDVDYSNYAVGYGKKKNRAWLQGIYGPHATSGQSPREWLSTSSEVSQKTWKFADLEGVDAKGKSANGNYWRYFGMPGESITYHDVPADAAAYFDRLSDGVCINP